MLYVLTYFFRFYQNSSFEAFCYVLSYFFFGFGLEGYRRTNILDVLTYLVFGMC